MRCVGSQTSRFVDSGAKCRESNSIPLGGEVIGDWERRRIRDKAAHLPLENPGPAVPVRSHVCDASLKVDWTAGRVE